MIIDEPPYYLIMVVLFLSLSCQIQTEIVTENEGGWRIKNAFPHLTFRKLTDIQAPRDSVNLRLFAVEQEGVIRVMPNDPTSTKADTFLDIRSHVTCCGEKGLLGLAFHPDYPDSGFFYVNYTADSPLRKHTHPFTHTHTHTP